MRSNPKRPTPSPNPTRFQKSDHAEPAHPEDFGKKTSPVRERLTRQVKEMPPEERIKKGP